jgi:steroid delta-isomerase-like uncharacterized protein
MKKKVTPLQLFATCTILFTLLFVTSCAAPPKDTTVEDNIKKYSNVWDEVLNKGKLDMISGDNFSADVTVYSGGQAVRGVDSVKLYYGNFLTGFTNIQFTINDIFGQGDKLVKYWTFKGTHTGDFFGIPATGKTVSLDGTTLVRMVNGKITEERDFYDNMDFMQQLGLLPKQ